MSFEKYKNALSEFVALKSVSTDKSYASEIQRCVEWLGALFKEGGFDVENWKGPNCNPVVYAKYVMDPKAETVLVYGHYDVQPALKEDGWDSDPFKLTEKSGRLFGRGVVDNKGQILVHVSTVLELIMAGALKYNVIFLIEGNEETANPDLGKLIKRNRKKLECDRILISDGELAFGKPAVEYSLRGGFNLTLIYKTAKTNLHSGIYGGAVPNAAFELSKFLAALFDKKNQVAIPGFYLGVDDVTPAQRKANRSLLHKVSDIFEMTGVKVLLMERGMDFYSQIGLRPTLQVTGIKTGYISEGYSNIIPNMAEARINFRTVKSQDNFKILEDFKEFVFRKTPKYVDYEISYTDPYDPVKIDITSKEVSDVKKTLKDAFDGEVLVKPVGGGIPVVSDFKDILSKDALLVPLGNDDCNMHGANENFSVDLIKKGLKFSRLFFGK